MTIPEPVRLQWESSQELDTLLAALENLPAVYCIEAPNGQQLIGRTSVLKRRLNRLLGAREGQQPSRMLTLRGLANAVLYWPVLSRLESSLTFYAVAKHFQPGSYRKLTNLRFPSYVRLILNNPFPRTQVTTQMRATGGLLYGPFRSRVSAEEFERSVLELFQLRRCQEDLEPHAGHPGCIYGEMSLCLRPCQEVVGVAEYATEAARVKSFFLTNGASLLESLEAQRGRLSQDMDFEQAARVHKRLEKVREVTKQRDPLAASLDHQYGVAVNRSLEQNSSQLRFLWDGAWRERIEFRLDVVEGRPVSLDLRLREVVEQISKAPVAIAEKQEHLALLWRWYYSSFREGEWLGFESARAIPYRRIVNAISRVMNPPGAGA